MSQNTSHAVMAQRIEAHDSLDDFPTPPWGTRALIEYVIRPRGLLGERAWDPACNRGYMVRPLKEYFSRVYSSDIFDYSPEWSGQERVVDFLFGNPQSPNITHNPPDWIITNPPFRLAEQFILTANRLAKAGCAMLVRTQFLEGIGRYERLFRSSPPSIVAIFTERLPMVKGRCDPKVSTATSYAWLVWAPIAPEPFQWIPPCRARLERPDDYGSQLAA